MDWADILKAWFDRWLKDDRTAALGPKVQVQDHTDRWRNAAAWPGGKSLTYFLNPDHELSTRASKEQARETVATDPFHTQGGYTTASPIENMACPQGACTYFETSPMKDELRIAGVPRVKLSVTPSGPGGYLSVYLYAADDDGYERIGWAQTDLRFTKSSTEPQPPAPGQELKLSFDMQPLDAVVAKGKRLYMVVSSGTGWNRIPGVPGGPIELAEGKGSSSIEIVRVTPRKSDFFEPKEPKEPEA